MKKILMIGPFPNPITGQSLANQILKQGLQDKKIKVDFLDTNTSKKLKSYKKQGKIELKTIYYSLLTLFVGTIKIIFKKYDVIYLTPGQTYLGFLKNSLFIVFGKLTGKKVYIHFHGGLFGNMYEELPQSKKKVIKIIFDKIDGVIVLSSSLKYMVENLICDNKVYICENGVENEYLIKEKKDNSKISILYLSNLMETKGILDLLEATKYFDENNINYELNLAGNIEEEIKEKVLIFLKNKKIIYNGVVSGNEKYRLLKNSNIFCLPTYYPVEGQPISILEAMGMGNVIVTTNQGGIKDIVKNRVNGIICEKKDAQSIYKSILKAYENFDEISKNNIREVQEKYTQEKFIDRIYKILIGEENENFNNNSKLQ